MPVYIHTCTHMHACTHTHTHTCTDTYCTPHRNTHPTYTTHTYIHIYLTHTLKTEETEMKEESGGKEIMGREREEQTDRQTLT